jgi:hypothetical protein
MQILIIYLVIINDHTNKFILYILKWGVFNNLKVIIKFIEP